jgi:uncharacterized protein YgiB involved in biofilm formation
MNHAALRPGTSQTAVSSLFPPCRRQGLGKSGLMVLLTLMSGALLLAGCDDNKKTGGQPPASAQQGKLYKDLDACLADATGMQQVTACREGYHQALQQMAQAPQYDQRANCEDVYGPGNCVPRGSVVQGGGGGFVPFMMGYMMGNMGGHTVYQPVFIDRGGSAFANGSRISNPSWSGGTPAAASPSSAVTRGGFGSTATASPHLGMGG